MVPPAVHLTTAHIAAVPDPYADISDKTLQAYKAYKAAITDPHSSCADLARLTGDLDSRRSAKLIASALALLACQPTNIQRTLYIRACSR